jgi:glycosyltransferase involved in cell wall biosynthesis
MLTEVDSQRALELYGRPADGLTPVVLNDSYRAAMENPRPTSEQQISPILFVGSNFFANRQAVEFLIKKLGPQLLHLPHIQIWIVGSGFTPNCYGDTPPTNVRLLGRVENLDEIYFSAAMVVVPIYSGAGMKVKVAEALMHGRPVIGTALALRGYIENSSTSQDHLLTASSPQEYIHAIQFVLDHQERLCASARRDYIDRFSVAAGQRRIRQILNIS